MNPVAEIRTLARQLALTHLAQRPFDFLSEPVSNERFLLDCLRGEVAYREQKAQERRIKRVNPGFCVNSKSGAKRSLR